MDLSTSKSEFLDLLFSNVLTKEDVNGIIFKKITMLFPTAKKSDIPDDHMKLILGFMVHMSNPTYFVELANMLTKYGQMDIIIFLLKICEISTSTWSSIWRNIDQTIDKKKKESFLLEHPNLGYNSSCYTLEEAIYRRDYDYLAFLLKNEFACTDTSGKKSIVCKILNENNHELKEIFKKHDPHFDEIIQLVLVKMKSIISAEDLTKIKKYMNIIIEYNLDIPITSGILYKNISDVQDKITRENYMQLFDILCDNPGDNSAKINWIIDNYANTDVDNFINHLKGRSFDNKNASYNKTSMAVGKWILQNDVKMFVDKFMFLPWIRDTSRCEFFSHYFKLPYVEWCVFISWSCSTMRISGSNDLREFKSFNRQIELTEKISQVKKLTELIAYVVFVHKNTIAMLLLSQKFDCLKFEVDETGSIISYNILRKEMKSARKI